MAAALVLDMERRGKNYFRRIRRSLETGILHGGHLLRMEPEKVIPFLNSPVGKQGKGNLT